MPYASMLYVANINTLATCTEAIFKKISAILLTPPPAYIIFYLVQESNL